MRISHSASNLFSECGYKYFLNYFRKLRPINNKSPLAVGDAIDTGLNHLLETRNTEEAVEKFKERWSKVARAGNIDYSKSDVEEHLLDDVVIKKESDRGYYSWLKKGEILIREYNDQVMPLIKEVIKVQIDDVMENEEGDELVVKTDFICKWHTGEVILFDNKTSSVKYTEDSVRTSPQLAVYFHALRDKYKIDKCGYIVIPKKVNKQKKPLVKIEVIIDEIPQNVIDNTLEVFHNNLDKIKQAQFQKNTESCIGIYGKCQYFSYCHEGKLDGLKEVK